MKTLLDDCLKHLNASDNRLSGGLMSYDLAVRVEVALMQRVLDSGEVGALSKIWDALHDWEEGLFLDDPNSPPERADQVDEVKAAMAVIHEALGVEHEET